MQPGDGKGLLRPTDGRILAETGAVNCLGLSEAVRCWSNHNRLLLLSLGTQLTPTTFVEKLSVRRELATVSSPEYYALCMCSDADNSIWVILR
jgi:hypothetical protein